MLSRIVCVLVVCVLGHVGGEALGKPEGKEAWQVGFAEADITPNEGQAMLAGFGQERHAKGTLDPLRAQALALRDRAGTTVLLITADVLGFGRVSVDAMRHKIQATHGVPPAAICFSASHTHWGPAINFRTNFYIGSVDVWYLDRLEATLLELVDQAIHNLSPSSIAYGACDVQIGMCRRVQKENGEFGWGTNPKGSYDSHTPVLRIRREKSPRQIVVVGHACHPTSMGNVEKWSADYPGVMRQVLESNLDDCRAMFVMGCGGDAKVVYRDATTNHYEFANSPEQSVTGGTHLADAVLSYLENEEFSELQAKLRTTLVRGSLSLQSPRSREQIKEMAYNGKPRDGGTFWARQSLAYPDRRKRQRYEVQAWQLGDLTLVALEGEVCADWGGMTRSLANTRHAMVIAYANNVPGYIPTARIIHEGGYEGNNSHMAYFLPAPFEPRLEQELTCLVLRALGRNEAGWLSSSLPNQDRFQASPTGEDKTDLLAFHDDDKTRAVTAPSEWEVRRGHILANLLSVLGPIPGRAYRVPLDVDVLEEVKLEHFTRKKISYNVDPYDRVESYLLIPHNLNGKTPAILALPPLHPGGKDLLVGLDGNQHFCYAKELAERGYIVIAPDYLYQGHYRENPRYNPYQKGYASATMKGVWNHMRAIDLLQSLPEVDGMHIGCLGHSLGGYNAVFLAALDPRVKATVACAGHLSLLNDAVMKQDNGDDMEKRSYESQIRRIETIYDGDPSQAPFSFSELIGAIAPRPLLAMMPKEGRDLSFEDAKQCLNVAQPVYELLGVGDRLQADYSYRDHEFTDAQRQTAYRFFDEAL